MGIVFSVVYLHCSYMSAQVVNIQDVQGSNFKITLNSAVEFGLVYNPVDNMAKAKVRQLHTYTLCTCKCTFSTWT